MDLRKAYMISMNLRDKSVIHSSSPGPYKNTVNLPKTKFNMRANSKQREPELQRFWAKEKVYERLSRENLGDIYTLHDGPPYANGDLHCGHALNKVTLLASKPCSDISPRKKI